MPIKARENTIGAWAFLLGIVLAVLVGFFTESNPSEILFGVLALIGVIIGSFVAEKEVKTFLLASVALVIVSFAGIQGMVLDAAIRGVAIGNVISSILGALLVLFVPAAIVVSLKTMFSIAKISGRG